MAYVAIKMDSSSNPYEWLKGKRVQPIDPPRASDWNGIGKIDKRVFTGSDRDYAIVTGVYHHKDGVYSVSCDKFSSWPHTGLLVWEEETERKDFKHLIGKRMKIKGSPKWGSVSPTTESGWGGSSRSSIVGNTQYAGSPAIALAQGEAGTWWPIDDLEEVKVATGTTADYEHLIGKQVKSKGNPDWTGLSRIALETWEKYATGNRVTRLEKRSNGRIIAFGGSTYYWPVEDLEVVETPKIAVDKTEKYKKLIGQKVLLKEGTPIWGSMGEITFEQFIASGSIKSVTDYYGDGIIYAESTGYKWFPAESLVLWMEIPKPPVLESKPRSKDDYAHLIGKSVRSGGNPQWNKVAKISFDEWSRDGTKNVVRYVTECFGSFYAQTDVGNLWPVDDLIETTIPGATIVKPTPPMKTCKFKVGDRIIGTHPSYYGITYKGWKGVVERINSEGHMTATGWGSRWSNGDYAINEYAGLEDKYFELDTSYKSIEKGDEVMIISSYGTYGERLSSIKVGFKGKVTSLDSHDIVHVYNSEGKHECCFIHNLAQIKGRETIKETPKDSYKGDYISPRRDDGLEFQTPIIVSTPKEAKLIVVNPQF